MRSGNPKHVADWGELAKPGVSVVTPNPKTSGAARWSFLAAYAYGLERNRGDEAAAERTLREIYHNVAVYDTGARAATNTFVDRGVGDVLVAGESEAFFIVRAHPKDYAIVTPSISILAQPPVTWVDANVAQHQTQAVARAYLEYLYSVPAQRLILRERYRPVVAAGTAGCLTHFASTRLITVGRFGGWSKAQTLFSEGGLFDRLSGAS